LKTKTHLFGPKKLRAKRANDLFKMLVTLPALLGAPRGVPGGGLLTPGLLLTGGLSYNMWFPRGTKLSATPRPSPGAPPGATVGNPDQGAGARGPSGGDEACYIISF
jgi:hypothetical protein